MSRHAATGAALPRVGPDATLSEALVEMTLRTQQQAATLQQQNQQLQQQATTDGLGQQDAPRGLTQIIGLALGSPEFQRR